jgi:transposase
MNTDGSLSIDPARLPSDLATCHALLLQLLAELHKSDARVADLEHRMDLLLRRLYGRSSEKLDPAQLALFDTSPEEPVPSLPLPAPRPAPTTSNVAKPGRHGRRRLPDRLKRVEKIYDLTPAEKELLGGEANLIKIGQEVTEQLEWEPSSLYVIRHVQLTYAHREPAANTAAVSEAGADQLTSDQPACGPRAADSQVAQRPGVNEPSTSEPCTDAPPSSSARPTIITAAKPPQPIPGGLPGPGLLAHVATAKYVDHVPLHRQERQYARHGLELSRQTTCDWAMAGAKLLLPLYDLTKQVVLASDVLHLDATSVKVCDARKKLRQTGYFWPLVGNDEHPLVAFEYTPNHTRDGPAAMLAAFRGFLQVDAHSVYDEIFARRDPATGEPVIIEVGCWMHARRKFFEARSVDRLRAETAIARIRQLYVVEREIIAELTGPWSALSRDERYARIVATRQERERPVLDELFAWVEAEAPALVPKNPVRQAMEYALRQQAALRRYCDHGGLAIDNGAAERAIRGIALGRKNWLFCGSERGARAACVYFSLAASCRRHEIDPFAYLRDIFTRLPVLLAETAGHPTAEQLRPLLPDRWQSA